MIHMCVTKVALVIRMYLIFQCLKHIAIGENAAEAKKFVSQ